MLGAGAGVDGVPCGAGLLAAADALGLAVSSCAGAVVVGGGLEGGTYPGAAGDVPDAAPPAEDAAGEDAPAEDDAAEDAPAEDDAAEGDAAGYDADGAAELGGEVGVSVCAGPRRAD